MLHFGAAERRQSCCWAGDNLMREHPEFVAISQSREMCKPPFSPCLSAALGVN